MIGIAIVTCNVYKKPHTHYVWDASMLFTHDLDNRIQR